jgi:hypothetical protein
MDHHVDAAITVGLRRRKIDVLTAFEDGAARLSDEEILARCAELNRVLFTLDHDFLEVAAEWQANQKHFTGIVFGRGPALSIGDAVNDVELIAEALLSQEMESRVIWIPL